MGVGKESRVAGHNSDVVIISFWAFKGVLFKVTNGSK